MLTILRHGSTDLNEGGALRGWLDVPLSPLGKEQAEIAGLALARETFDCVYTSDLQRAVDTAVAIGKWHKDLSIRWTPELRPINFGELQGRPYAEIKEKLDRLWFHWKQELSIRAPGGESFEDFQNRIYPFLQSLLTVERNILLVTHTRVCSYIMAVAMNDGKCLSGDALDLMKVLEVSCANVVQIEGKDIKVLNPIRQKE